jgi:hypothetical protein
LAVAVGTRHPASPPPPPPQEARLDMLLLRAGRVAFLGQQFAVGCELFAQAPLDPRELIALYPELQVSGCVLGWGGVCVYVEVGRGGELTEYVCMLGTPTTPRPMHLLHVRARLPPPSLLLPHTQCPGFRYKPRYFPRALLAGIASGSRAPADGASPDFDQPPPPSDRLGVLLVEVARSHAQRTGVGSGRRGSIPLHGEGAMELPASKVFCSDSECDSDSEGSQGARGRGKAALVGGR